MRVKIQDLFHKGRRVAIIIIKQIMKLIPKQRNLILFGSWFGNKYADNTKYVYEYLLGRDDLEIYWYTRNTEVYNKLKQEGKPVLLSSQPKAIWKQIRAHFLFATIGLIEFNTFFLSKCKFIDLDHGSPIKDSGFDQYHYNRAELQTKEDKRSIAFLKLLEDGIEYYKVVASNDVGNIIMKAFHLQPNRVLNLGRPRNDIFYDEALRKELNNPVRGIKENKKAIVYMPTHRSDGQIKMPMNELLDMQRIQDICEKYNYVFLIKKHYYHRNEVEDTSKFSNIFDITNEEIDPQILLYEADALISDYSACFIDYLVLNRPIIFYPFDFEQFIKQERGMYLSYDEIAVGPRAYNKDELSLFVEDLCKEAPDNFDKKRIALRNFYFSEHNQKCVRGQIADFIDEIIRNY